MIHIIASNYHAAWDVSRAYNVPPARWKYISRAAQVRARKPGMTVWLHSWPDRLDGEGRLRMRDMLEAREAEVLRVNL